jgi:hypothetical protein
MINPFRKPYSPVETIKEKMLFIIIFGVFIFLFLFLFKPFGLAQLKSKTQLFIDLGFGLVTIFVLIIFKFIFEPIVINNRWTFGKSILWGLLIGTSIGIANYFYINIIYHQQFVFKYFLFTIGTALMVGIIPVSIGYIISSNRIYKAALKKASISPDEVLWENEIIIRGGNPKNECKLNPKSIVYLCSNDNYITIVTIQGDALTKTHLRGTLRAAEDELIKNTSFMRCHKCYIVNTQFADHLTGNVQNLKIKLKPQGLEIPVSRSKAAEVTSKFR